ncbi:MAG: hypothetical protein NTU78_14640 [Alphaproteobacteria bacterium]|nr:hypothetical protein [Alphaproteobacteria bacterium]
MKSSVLKLLEAKSTHDRHLWKGFDAADLEDAQLVLGDRPWRVKATMPKPAPSGEAEGELYLFLIEDTA